MCRRKSHKCRVCPGDKTRRAKNFSSTMGIPSGFLMGASVICVRRRRHDATLCGQVRVRTDQVQCDIFTAQYKLFNFGVNKFIAGVNTNHLGVNSYPNGVNPVSRVIQNIWCEWFSIVHNTLFWYDQTSMVCNPVGVNTYL